MEHHHQRQLRAPGLERLPCRTESSPPHPALTHFGFISYMTLDKAAQDSLVPYLRNEEVGLVSGTQPVPCGARQGPGKSGGLGMWEGEGATWGPPLPTSGSLRTCMRWSANQWLCSLKPKLKQSPGTADHSSLSWLGVWALSPVTLLWVCSRQRRPSLWVKSQTLGWILTLLPLTKRMV